MTTVFANLDVFTSSRELFFDLVVRNPSFCTFVFLAVLKIS